LDIGRCPDIIKAMENLYKTYILPDGNREELKKTRGIIISGTKERVGKEVRRLLERKKYHQLITVGDFCSVEFPFSDIKVCDRKTKRGDFKIDFDFSLHCANPAGTIQKEAWNIIEEAIKNNQNVLVEGEEDLLALPAIILAPVGSVVIRGIPDKGVSFIEITPEIKKAVENLLRIFNAK